MSPIWAKMFAHEHFRSRCHLQLSVSRVLELGSWKRRGQRCWPRPSVSQGPSTPCEGQCGTPLVCFHGPAWISMAWGPCQLWKQWCSPCLRRRPHLQPKGTDRRVSGKKMPGHGGRGFTHVCSMSVCEPRIKEQPWGDPAAAAVEGC